MEEDKVIIDYLKKQIEKFEKLQKQMDIGERYYDQENDILERKKIRGAVSQDKNGKPVYHNVTDTTRANHKLPSGFVKQQVQQKVNYLINDEITITEDIDEIDGYLPSWKKDLKRAGITASKKIYAVWQWYTKDNVLKYKMIDPKQIIVEFEEDNKDIIKTVTHYFEDDDDDVTKAIIYTSDNKIELEKGKSKWKVVNVGPHAVDITEDANGKVLSSEDMSFGRPPFSILFNNDEMQTDTYPIKPYIDIYDITISDFSNNIDDFQEIIAVLKGYGGENPAQFLNQMKILGAVPIDEDGDIDFKQGIIPVEARKEFLQMARKNIFEFGMAVDVQDIATGNATNVAIQSMYENLNMKASQFEQELQDFWQQVLYFINLYYDLELENELVFDKNMLSNQKDNAEINKLEAQTIGMLTSMLSNKAIANILSNLNFIEDKSDLSEEEILESVVNKAEEFRLIE